MHLDQVSWYTGRTALLMGRHVTIPTAMEEYANKTCISVLCRRGRRRGRFQINPGICVVGFRNTGHRSLLRPNKNPNLLEFHPWIHANYSTSQLFIQRLNPLEPRFLQRSLLRGFLWISGSPCHSCNFGDLVNASSEIDEYTLSDRPGGLRTREEGIVESPVRNQTDRSGKALEDVYSFPGLLCVRQVRLVRIGWMGIIDHGYLVYGTNVGCCFMKYFEYLCIAKELKI
jgi:hypothetical protein